LLAAHAEAKAELASVTNTLAGLLAKTSAGPPGNVTVTQHVDATGERAIVIQAGRDARIGDLGKMVLGARRVHLQQITATDASVVIQVGRDLYVSDPVLTVLWAPGETTPGECPYPGLDAFGPGQARWFFGREKETGDLLQMLDDALRGGCGGPVTVVGPSGAGKSSLLGAGLLGGLAEGRLPAAGSDSWPRLVITPGAYPSRILREALQACAQARGDDTATRTVVVVDQMEEVFTACDDEAERAEFLAALADLAAPRSQGGPAALVVLGLRADFFARATAYPVLRSALASRQIVLGAMSPAELRQAITLPARTSGFTFDGGLVERLLGDLGVDETAGYEPGRLPLLGHALRATWQRRDGDRLTIAGYEATGGIGGAIAKTADDVYARLDEAGQSAARQVFLGLVRIGESGEADGGGTADTRRRVSAESLCGGSANPDAARAALDGFIAARLLTSGGRTVEISHDALLRRWPRLQDWIRAKTGRGTSCGRVWRKRQRPGTERDVTGPPCTAASGWRRRGHGPRIPVTSPN
jgi:Novel STAND NTPase 1